MKKNPAAASLAYRREGCTVESERASSCLNCVVILGGPSILPRSKFEGLIALCGDEGGRCEGTSPSVSCWSGSRSFF